jgi:hypothetical protein
MDYKVFAGSILVVVFVVMAIWVAGWLWITWPS